jgi:hypothetical protein
MAKNLATTAQKELDEQKPAKATKKGKKRKPWGSNRKLANTATKEPKAMSKNGNGLSFARNGSVTTLIFPQYDNLTIALDTKSGDVVTNP